MCGSPLPAGIAAPARGGIDVDPGHELRADTTSGEALYRAIRELYPEPPVIPTAWTQLEAAVSSSRARTHYLQKPWDDQKLLTTVANLLELSAARRALARGATIEARGELAKKFDGAWYLRIRARDRARVPGRARLTPVLITGPNGAGKEKIA